ncbi:MAG: clostripain-related cysteine peptidase [Bacteroidales bacterium]|nr:clostripain-related cysteine peptidase [Bacteroidales bacterium]
MQQILKWIFGALTLLCLASCKDNDPIVKPDPQPLKSEHTLLIYICGDNSLSSIVNPNIRDAQEGLLSSSHPLNLIIYKDNNDRGEAGYPSLFQLRVKSDHTLDTLYLKKWDTEKNSADFEHFAEVVSTTFKQYDTPIKGLEIWGHGRSWIPNVHVEPKSRFVSVDGNKFMELWEMHEALDRTAVHLNYILFDACFMGTAEVAYELRNNCDWILASPAEDPDKGYPYTPFIERLSEVSASNDASRIPNVLKKCIDSFAEFYVDRGTIALYDESKMEPLHTAYKKLLTDYADFYNEVPTNPSHYEAKLQHYGRTATGDRYHFYDLGDFARLAGGNLDSEIANAVVYRWGTKYYDGAGTVEFPNSCGFAFTPPHFFSLSNSRQNLENGYTHIEWGK